MSGAASTPSDLVIGIDEAGRGPILGPMVMACVALRPRKAAVLTRAGVMDSKKFGTGDDAHAARAALVPRILECAEHFAVAVIDVHEIDRRCMRGELNRLEQEQADAFLRCAPAARRIVCDGKRLFGPLAAKWLHLEALDHGESQHVAVAAASVLAKTQRDRIFAKISARYAADYGGPIQGGGYVNPGTRAFLRAYIERNHAIPPEGRKSWPWTFAADLLGDDYDPCAGYADLIVPEEVTSQLALAL